MEKDLIEAYDADIKGVSGNIWRRRLHKRVVEEVENSKHNEDLGLDLDRE